MKYEYVTSAARLPGIAAEVATAEVLAEDLETTGFDPHTSKIRLWSINTGKHIYVIDMFQTGGPGPLVQAHRDTKAITVGQNLKFDVKHLLHAYGLYLDPIFDTFKASSLVYNGLIFRKHSLWDLYERELGMKPTVEDLGGSDWSAPVLTQAQLDYAADDVINLPALRHVLRQKLIDLGLVTVAKIEFDAVVAEAEMELNGFFLNKEDWIALADSNKMHEAAFAHALLETLPHPKGQGMLPGFEFAKRINLQSPDQILASLKLMGLPIENTNEATLAMVSDQFPVVKQILDYREYAQCVKSFGPDYLRHINKATGRVHTSFFPFTGCGRYASEKPNLQNVPRKKEFRSCFQAAPGKTLVIADFSQVELRCAAEIANDEMLLGVYQRAEDAHTQTAALVSGVGLADVTKGQRSAAKAINFGLIYGMSAQKLPVYAKKGYGVTMTEDEAFLYHRRFFENYRGLARWHQKVFSKGHRAKGQVRTSAGRLRYVSSEMYNEFSNTEVQGSCADGMKRALRNVFDRLHKYRDSAKMVHMVHDEIVLEVKNDPAVIARATADLEAGMVEGMQSLMKRVPIVVESGVGPTWAEK